MSAMVRHIYADEVESLLEQGLAPSSVLRTLDLNPGTLARALHRHGRNDLARPFWALERERR